MSEKISEEFADDLLGEYMSTDNYNFIEAKNIMKKRWKEKFYIIKSREDELREKIENVKNNYPAENIGTLLKTVDWYQELIKILDNKIKEK